VDIVYLFIQFPDNKEENQQDIVYDTDAFGGTMQRLMKRFLTVVSQNTHIVKSEILFSVEFIELLADDLRHTLTLII
jgi:hypothetical protein